MKTKNLSVLLLALLGLGPQFSSFAQSTAFTYQGRLNDGAAPANGLYDLEFSVFNATNGGSAFVGPLTNSAVAVSNGLFTTLLDFGPDLFDGPGPVFLEIAVRPSGGDPFTTLNPRQPITPVPHAISSSFASAAAIAFNVAAGAAVKSLNSLTDAVRLAAGQNVTITPSGNTLTIASPTGGIGPWQVSGTNTFYNAGDVGIGTSTPRAKLHLARGDLLAGASGAEWIFHTRSHAGSDFLHITDSDGGVFQFQRGLILNQSGRVGIGTTAPQAPLEVRGDIRLGSSGQFQATSGEERLRIVRGSVAANGNILRGTGFTVSHPAIGDYHITFTTPFGGPPTVTASMEFTPGHFHVSAVPDNPAADSVNVVTGGFNWTEGQTFFIDEPFHFIAIGPR